MSRVQKSVGSFLLLFIILPILLSGYMPAADAYFHLLIGWTTFLPGRLSQVTVNWSGVGMMLVCLALTGGFAHSFCAWLWRAGGRADPWHRRWTMAGIAIVVLMFVSGMAVTGLAHQVGWLMTAPELVRRSGTNARNATTSLKTITSAQADFRANDRDWNHENDFWRGDIAGLYALKSRADPEGPAIKLIELSVALADDRPVTEMSPYGQKGPKAGYWYRALRHAGEKEPDPQRFAAVSFPSSPSAGKFMFIVCEDNILYRKDYQGEVPAWYPADPLADGWTRLD